jgi:hypothetical protein
MIEVFLPRPLGGGSLLTIVLTTNKLPSIKKRAHGANGQLAKGSAPSRREVSKLERERGLDVALLVPRGAAPVRAPRKLLGPPGAAADYHPPIVGADGFVYTSNKVHPHACDENKGVRRVAAALARCALPRPLLPRRLPAYWALPAC